MGIAFCQLMSVLEFVLSCLSSIRLPNSYLVLQLVIKVRDLMFANRIGSFLLVFSLVGDYGAADVGIP